MVLFLLNTCENTKSKVAKIFRSCWHQSVKCGWFLYKNICKQLFKMPWNISNHCVFQKQSTQVSITWIHILFQIRSEHQSQYLEPELPIWIVREETLRQGWVFQISFSFWPRRWPMEIEENISWPIQTGGISWKYTRGGEAHVFISIFFIAWMMICALFDVYLLFRNDHQSYDSSVFHLKTGHSRSVSISMSGLGI